MYSQQALKNTQKEFYQNCNEETIQRYIRELDISIQNEKPVVFTENESNAFDEWWKNEKEHFFDSVYVRLAYTGPIEKL